MAHLSGGRGRRRLRSREVRPRHRHPAGAAGAGRRAGGFPAIRARPGARPRGALVGGGAGRRGRLDPARHAQDPARLVPGRAGAGARRARRARRRADADVRGGLRLRGAPGHRRGGADDAVRRRLAAEDQRHQRLCGLHRLVELLFAPHPQPSGPRGLARLQRRHRAAADGTGHRQDHRQHALALRRGGLGLGGRAGGGPRHQQAAGPVAARHRIQAGASLRHQSRGHRRDGAGDPDRVRGACGLGGGARRALRADAGAGRGVHGRARHRLGDERPLLPRPDPEDRLARRVRDHLPGLRAPVRARGHGPMPRLCGADLLALLLPRRPLRRPLQAARAPGGAGAGGPVPRGAGPHRRLDRRAARALPRADDDPGGGGRAHPRHRACGRQRRAPRAPGGAGGGPHQRVPDPDRHPGHRRLALRARPGEPPGRPGGDGAPDRALPGRDRGP